MVNKLDISSLLRATKDVFRRSVLDKLNELVNYQYSQVLTDGASVVWDMKKGYNATVTLGGNRTLVVAGLTNGDYGTITIVQDNAGNRTLTLPSNSKVSGGGAGSITLSTAGGSIDMCTFYYDGTTLYWNLATNFT